MLADKLVELELVDSISREKAGLVRAEPGPSGPSTLKKRPQAAAKTAMEHLHPNTTRRLRTSGCAGRVRTFLRPAR